MENIAQPYHYRLYSMNSAIASDGDCMYVFTTDQFKKYKINVMPSPRQKTWQVKSRGMAPLK